MRIIFLCYAMQAVCEETSLLLPKHVSLPLIQYGCSCCEMYSVVFEVVTSVGAPKLVFLICRVERNAYAKLLLRMLKAGSLEDPFLDSPPPGSLRMPETMVITV